MFRAYAPFLIGFSKEAQEMLGCPSAVAAATAFRQIAAFGGGFDIAHVPVTIGEASYAASSRVMSSGTIVIEVDTVPRGLSPRLVTGAEWREAMKTVATHRGRAAR